MTLEQQYVPGIYVVKTRTLNVRGTPSTQHNGNLTGTSLTVGNRVRIHRIVSDLRNNGWVWGVVSDPSQQDERYVCLWNLNTVFAELVEPSATADLPTDPQSKTWMKEVHAFLVSKGFKGNPPF